MRGEKSDGRRWLRMVGEWAAAAGQPGKGSKSRIGREGGCAESSSCGSTLSHPRFYKLHERKCEPIVMTVPRKVRTPRVAVHCWHKIQSGVWPMGWTQASVSPDTAKCDALLGGGSCALGKPERERPAHSGGFPIGGGTHSTAGMVVQAQWGGRGSGKWRDSQGSLIWRGPGHVWPGHISIILQPALAQHSGQHARHFSE